MGQAPAMLAVVLGFEDFELNTRTGELRKGDARMRLQEQCFQILLLLLSRPGEVVTREQLRAALWPNGTVVDFEHSVNAAIKRLRAALNDSADEPRFIETLPRRGYRFLVPVRDESGSNPTAVAPPRFLDHYEVLATIGSGASGVVYRARDRRLGREVAIKVLLSLSASDPSAVRRFKREAVATMTLQHPNVLTIHDVGETDGVPYIVSELLQGSTLRERMASPLPRSSALEYGVQVLRGLAAAHIKGIIHRDLKPENIFVTSDGQVKILDFGLAKLKPSGDDPAITMTEAGSTLHGTVLGTVGYMSPEQVRGESLDHRSDIFAFGAMLYEMVTGQRAFSGGTPVDTLSAILNAEPEQLRAGMSSLPADLQTVLRRCLEKTRERRFQSAREIIGALQALDHRAPVLPPRSWHLAVRWGAALAFVLVLATAAWMISRPNEFRPNVLGNADASDQYQRGREFLYRYDKPGNVDQAIACFNAALKRDPNFALAFAALGDAYWTRFRLDKDPNSLQSAAENARKSVELNDRLPAVHVTLGRIHLAKGEIDLSLADFQHALGLDARNAEAQIGLGGAYEQQGRPAEAEDAFRKAAALRPEDWIGYNELGNFYRRKYRYADAAEQFRRALQLVPDNVGLHVNLGGALKYLGDMRGAEGEFRQSLQIAPNYYAYVSLGILYYEQRRFAESAEMTEKALELNKGNDYRLWLTLAVAYEWLGEHEKARNAYDQEFARLTAIATADQRDPLVHAELALLYAKRQQRDLALTRMQAALALAPADKRVLVNVGEAYEHLGDRRLAIRYIAQAVSKGLTLEDLQRNPDLRAFLADATARRALDKAKAGSAASK